MYPKVIVLTLTYNCEQWLNDFFESILQLDYPNYEIVMVDNGSTDGSVERISKAFPTVKILENNRNMGYSSGYNVGLKYAAEHGGDYFLILNNDSILDPKALQSLVDVAQSYDRAGFVSGKVYFYEHPNILQTVGKMEHPIYINGNHIGSFESDQGQYDQIEERAFLDDAMILVDRRVYDEIGGYDPQYFLQVEEFDWQMRAKQRGWKCYYSPKAKMWHKVSMSMGGAGNPIGRYYDTRSQMVAMARYLSPLRFLLYFSWVGFHTTFSLLKGLVQFNGEKIKPRFARWLGFITGTLWLFHRKPAQGIPALILWLSR